MAMSVLRSQKCKPSWTRGKQMTDDCPQIFTLVLTD